MTTLPTFSVIIPVRPGSPIPPAARSVADVNYPLDHIEVLLAEGNNPSLQRNAAIAQARGDLIYLLDDDSVLSKKALRYAVEVFAENPDPEFVCVGGPVLTNATDSAFQKAAGAAMGSVFGLGPNRHRHVAFGLVRPATEKELISANMVMRRQAVDRAGGFDERLYPNEENEFLKRVHTAGMRCMYHPLMAVFGSRRRNLGQVFVQNFRYGKGRARHYFRNRQPIDVLFWVPTLFLGACVAFAVHPRWYTAIPLAAYALLCGSAAAFTALVMRRPVQTFVHLATIFPTMHLAYGIGFLAGLLPFGHRRKIIDRQVHVRCLRELGTP